MADKKNQPREYSKEEIGQGWANSIPQFVLNAFYNPHSEYSEKVLKDFVRTVREDMPINRGVLEYVTQAFEMILEEEEPAVALGLKSNIKGRKKGGQKQENHHLELALEVAKRIQNGVGKEKAYELSGGETAKKAYRRHKDMATEAAKKGVSKFQQVEIISSAITMDEFLQQVKK